MAAPPPSRHGHRPRGRQRRRLGGGATAPSPALRPHLDRTLRSPRSRPPADPRRGTGPGRPRGGRDDLATGDALASPTASRSSPRWKRSPTRSSRFRSTALGSASSSAAPPAASTRPSNTSRRSCGDRTADRRARSWPRTRSAPRRKRWRGSSASKGRSRPSRPRAAREGSPSSRPCARCAAARSTSRSPAAPTCCASPPTPDSTRCARWRKDRAGRFEPIGPGCRSARAAPSWCSSLSITCDREAGRALAELLGAGSSCDASHMTAPQRGWVGRGAGDRTSARGRRHRPPTKSTSSTPTAPARRSTTPPSPRRSRACSGSARAAFRSKRPRACSDTCWEPPAPSKRSRR